MLSNACTKRWERDHVSQTSISFVEQWLYGSSLDFSTSTVWKAKLEMFTSAKVTYLWKALRNFIFLIFPPSQRWEMEYVISSFKFILEKVNIHLGNNIFDDFYKYGKGES